MVVRRDKYAQWKRKLKSRQHLRINGDSLSYQLSSSLIPASFSLCFSHSVFGQTPSFQWRKVPIRILEFAVIRLPFHVGSEALLFVQNRGSGLKWNTHNPRMLGADKVSLIKRYLAWINLIEGKTQKKRGPKAPKSTLNGWQSWLNLNGNYWALSPTVLEVDPNAGFSWPRVKAKNREKDRESRKADYLDLIHTYCTYAKPSCKEHVKTDSDHIQNLIIILSQNFNSFQQKYTAAFILKWIY